MQEQSSRLRVGVQVLSLSFSPSINLGKVHWISLVSTAKRIAHLCWPTNLIKCLNTEIVTLFLIKPEVQLNS